MTADPLTWDDETIQACKCKITSINKNDEGGAPRWQLTLDPSHCPVHGNQGQDNE